jgi:hypothetical protein
MASQTCINLRARWGDVYRLSFDEASEHRDDPWMMEIRGRFGTIHPHGGEALAVEVDGHRRLAARLGREMGLQIHQGDDGKPVSDPRKDWGGDMTFLFPACRFQEVAEVIRPYRKRQVSEEERQRLAALSREHSPFRKVGT